MVLKKETVLYDRNDEGKFIPKEVALEIDENDSEQLKYKGETIFVTPMSRSEIKETFANISIDKNRDIDAELVIKHCKKPEFSIDDKEFMKPALVSCIVNTIFRESGLDINKNDRKKAQMDAEDDFAKN